MSSRLQNLECLQVNDCNRLRNVFQHSCITRDLINVKTTCVVNCTMTGEITVAGDQEEFTNVIVFPELTNLGLTNLPSFTSFWSHQSGEANAYEVQFPLVHSNITCDGNNLEDIGLVCNASTSQLNCLDFNCDKEIQLL